MKKPLLFMIPLALATIGTAIITYLFLSKFVYITDENGSLVELRPNTISDQREDPQVYLKTTEVSFPSNPELIIQAELATTPKEREVGLMYRKKLREGNGMLFVFENEQQLNFWMKNTYIPLDIIFINKDKTINTIHKNTKPLQTEEIYSSKIPSLFVLEVNAGFTDKYNIREGDIIDFEIPNNLDVDE